MWTIVEQDGTNHLELLSIPPRRIAASPIEQMIVTDTIPLPETVPAGVAGTYLPSTALPCPPLSAALPCLPLPYPPLFTALPCPSLPFTALSRPALPSTALHCSPLFAALQLPPATFTPTTALRCPPQELRGGALPCHPLPFLAFN